EFDDNVGARAGSLVDPLLHRLAFDDVAEFHHPIDFGDDGRGVGIPFRNQLAGLDVLAFGFAQLGAIDERVAFALALADVEVFALDLGGDNHFAMPRHHDQRSVASRHGVDAMQPHDAFGAGFQSGLLRAPAGGAADMERAH